MSSLVVEELEVRSLVIEIEKVMRVGVMVVRKKMMFLEWTKRFLKTLTMKEVPLTKITPLKELVDVIEVGGDAMEE
nr:proteasome subunit beta type-7-B-like [Tanacetum cinerariifolium]